MKFDCVLLFSVAIAASISLAPLPVHAQQEGGQNSGIKLFGRIEQLDVSSGGIPKLDLPSKKSPDSDKPSVEQSKTVPLSGRIVDSYPLALTGEWGGKISVKRRTATDTYANDNPTLAKYESDAFVPGLTGTINFKFKKKHGGTELEPLEGFFEIPICDTTDGEQARALLSEGHKAYLLEGKGAPWGPFLAFGAMNPTQLTEENLSSAKIGYNLRPNFRHSAGATLDGQPTKSLVLKNILRQLDDSTFEQDLVSRTVTGRKKTKAYQEWVVRLHKEADEQTLTFKIARTNFDAQGQFASEMEFQGEVKHGIKVDTALRADSIQPQPYMPSSE
ncbi:MAG TPA: hypothetical protein V6C97_10190 [Oculatellaceae cyanobacterium]